MNLYAVQSDWNGWEGVDLEIWCARDREHLFRMLIEKNEGYLALFHDDPLTHGQILKRFHGAADKAKVLTTESPGLLIG